MWRIYLLFGLFMAIYSVVIIIAYGIRISTRLDVDNLSVCVKVYIFDWIEIFCIKIFVSDALFYYQLNKNDIKLLKSNDSSAKSKKHSKEKKKTRYLSYLWYIVENAPKIRLSSGIIEYGTSIDDIKNRSILNGAALTLLNTALAVAHNKIAFDEINMTDISSQSSFRGVYLNGVIKFSLIKIILYSLRIITVKRRFQTA